MDGGSKPNGFHLRSHSLPMLPMLIPSSKIDPPHRVRLRLAKFNGTISPIPCECCSRVGGFCHLLPLGLNLDSGHCQAIPLQMTSGFVGALWLLCSSSANALCETMFLATWILVVNPLPSVLNRNCSSSATAYHLPWDSLLPDHLNVQLHSLPLSRQ